MYHLEFTPRSSTAGLASVSKNILGLERWGLNSSSCRDGKMGCMLLCHASYLLADDCSESLKSRPQKANGGVFSQAACRRCQVWGSSKRADWVSVSFGDVEKGGLLHLCTVTRETSHPYSGVAWGPCKHQNNHFSTVVPSVPGGVYREQRKHLLCLLFVEMAFE